MFLLGVASILCVAAVQVAEGQSRAELDGRVWVKLYVPQPQFPLETFRTLTASYSSKYCKLDEGNCITEDKQIRTNDVFVSNVTGSGSESQVKVYVRDRFDNTQTGIKSLQLANVFITYNQEFSADIDIMTEVIDPIPHQGLEAWEIALISVACVIVVIIILAIIGCCCCRSSASEKEAEAATGVDVDHHLTMYDSVKMTEHEAKAAAANPYTGYANPSAPQSQPVPPSQMYHQASPPLPKEVPEQVPQNVPQRVDDPLSTGDEGEYEEMRL